MRRLDPCEVGGGEVKHKMVEQTSLNRRLFKRQANCVVGNKAGSAPLPTS